MVRRGRNVSSERLVVIRGMRVEWAYWRKKVGHEKPDVDGLKFRGALQSRWLGGRLGKTWLAAATIQEPGPMFS